MKLFSAAAVLSVVVSTVNALTVNTPASVVQCQPLLITWDPQGSAGPFFLSVHPGDNPTGTALFSWDNLTGTSFTWVVNVASGTNLGLLLRDNTGATSQSAPFQVQAGSTTDCSGSSSVGSSLPGTSISTVPGSSSSLSVSSVSPALTSVTTTPTSTSTRPPSSVSTPTSVRSSVTSSPSPTATGGASGAALSNVANFGFAGLFAALVGAVLA